MIRLRKSRSGGDPEVSKSALEGCTGGDITIVISGEKLDSNITYLGCQVAKMAGRKVHLLHVIVVPRTLPLKAVLTRETEQADYLLNESMKIAVLLGCQAVSEIVQARDAGRAIVEETKDNHCSLLFMGWVQKSTKGLDETVLYVLENAPCRVWLVEVPASKKTLEIELNQ